MKRFQFRRLPIILGVILLLITFYLFYQRTTPARLTFSYNPPKGIQTQTAGPRNLIISKLSLSLPVFPALVTNGVWETTTKGVSFLRTSPQPGEVGNSILYAHNWPNLLGNLHRIVPGNEITVIDKEGESKTFIVTYTATVDPQDDSILAPSKDRRITLYTCSGFLDSKRFVVVAQLSDNISINLPSQEIF